MDKQAQMNLAIFCAALQGFASRDDTSGRVVEDQAHAAVNFARAVVRHAYNYDEKRNEPLLS